MKPPRPHRLSRIVLAAGLVAALVAMPASPVGARGESNVDIDSFMTGLACTESTGRYTAENDRSGAYGKYQIMPRNWRAWAGRYLGNRWAQPTPRNQEFVAQRRIEDLYELRGKWRRVAYWWLTGDGEGDESKWTKHAALYVRRVMGAVQAAAVTRRARRRSASRPVLPGRLCRSAGQGEPLPRVRVTGGRVYIRREAGSEYRAIGTVRRDQKLAVLGRALDARGKPWLKVGLPHGEIGWIAKWFTERIECGSPRALSDRSVASD